MHVGLIVTFGKATARLLIIEAHKIFKLRKSRTPQTQQYIKNLNLVPELSHKNFSSQKIMFP